MNTLINHLLDKEEQYTISLKLNNSIACSAYAPSVTATLEALINQLRVPLYEQGNDDDFEFIHNS